MYGKTRGYSLLNLLTSLAVSAILLGIGLPSMASFITTNRISTHVTQFAGALAFARTEAITRNQSVIICKSKDQLKCSTESAWHEGWMIFVDDNQNHQYDDHELVLLRDGLPHANLWIDYKGFESHAYVVFRPIGATTSNGSFTLCDTTATGSARALIINRSGRIRASTSKADGTPLVCG
jgi:type IV fimbrial biogenesis protein FimT